MKTFARGTGLVGAAWARRAAGIVAAVAFAVSCVGRIDAAAAYVLVGWSGEGVHEFDSTDASVFALGLPGSSLHAQLISGGALVRSTNGIVVSYEAVADASGSINTSSSGKVNFFQYAAALLGSPLKPDQGPAGFSMPGPANAPQPMAFDHASAVFNATGIPVTPYDDRGAKNFLPMMRLTARNSQGTVLATTDVPLPVTDELDCRACHASGSQVSARPAAGWAWDCDPVRDYKLNILRYHDNARANWTVYRQALLAAGLNPAGLEATVVQDGRPVLCLRCHASNAMKDSGLAGMRPMTQLIHTKHAFATDPASGAALTSLTNGAACYLCHASSGGLYERGAHRAVVGGDGTPALQCQNCHGALADVGAPGRRGWVDLPVCQSCHQGSALVNGGLPQRDAFSAPGVYRRAADLTFATGPLGAPAGTNPPAAPLFHAAAGHGGLQCAACHGAAHAELASSRNNDNAQSQRLQSHTGVLLDCASCHVSRPATGNQGPHGLHPADATWASRHGDDGVTQAGCQACHGADLRGNRLARVGGLRSFGRQPLWQGREVSCYTCHNGPTGGDDGGGAGYRPATVASSSASAVGGGPIVIPVQATDPNGLPLSLRIVSPPAHGTAAAGAGSVTYFPAAGYVGPDAFSVAAYNGWLDSNLATVNTVVAAGACSLTAGVAAPAAVVPNGAAPFFAQASLQGCSAPLTYRWDFGDGSAPGSGPAACHAYPAEGAYPWTLTVTGAGLSKTVSGSILVSATLGPPLELSLTSLGFAVNLAWTVDSVPVSIENSFDLNDPHGWTPLTDAPQVDGTNALLMEFVLPGQQFFRLRRVP